MCSLSDRCASLSVYFSCCLASPDSCSSEAPLSLLPLFHIPLPVALPVKYCKIFQCFKRCKNYGKISRENHFHLCECVCVCVHMSGRGCSVTCLCIISSVFILRNCLHILMKLPHDACQRPQHAPRQDKEEEKQGGGLLRRITR